MTRREAWLSVLLVFVVALVARVLYASQIVFPKPEDSAYYFGVARNIIEGRGLVSDAMWSYGTGALEFPRHAFEIWMPLPAFLAVVPMAVFGTTFAASQVPFILLGAVVPVLAWRLAADVAVERDMPTARARWLGLGVGLTAAVYLPLLLHSALPDSTMPFAAFALGACLLMTRLVRDPRGARILDPRLLGLGLLLGLAALTRNEVAWLAITWVVLAWLSHGTTVAERVRLIGVAGVVALLVFVPWLARNAVVLGSPLPGQAISNALSVTGFDIFAWNDPPTLSRYLAEGPARLLEMRVVGTWHNLGSVLLYLGVPISVIGLVALPWQGRGAALRPLVILSLLTFLVTSLFFPVATTWGTFLHAAGPVHVLLIISALLALDAVIVWVGGRRGWTRPVAWLGAAFGISASLLFSAVLLPSFGAGSRDTQAQYAVIASAMADAGHPLDASTGPVIANFPIWLAESQRIPTLALPDEPADDVLDLARHFPGTRLVILIDPASQHWPSELDTARGAECFRRIPLSSTTPEALDGVTAWEIVCS